MLVTTHDPLDILYLTDTPDEVALIEQELNNQQVCPKTVQISTAQALSEHLGSRPWDIILASCHLSRMNGHEVLGTLRQLEKDIPVIFVSSTLNEHEAVHLFKSGAQDYICKEDLSRLAPAILREVRDARYRNTLRLVEKAYFQSEARFKQVFESNILGIFFADVNTGLITDANGAYLNMLGYTEEDLAMGRLSWKKLTPEEFKEQDIHKAQELLQHRRITPYEKEYFCKDGSRLYVTLGAAMLEGSDALSVCYALDLSSRKAAESALIEQTARQEGVVYISQKALSGMALEDLFHLALQQVQTLLQSEGAILFGRGTQGTNWRIEATSGILSDVEPNQEIPLNLLLTAEGTETLLCNGPGFLSQGVQSVLSSPIEKNLIGILSVCYQRPMAFSDKDQQFLKTVNNILAMAMVRKNSEIRLRESEERFRTMAEASSLMIVMLSPTGQMVYANQALIRFLGVESYREIEDHWQKYVHIEDQDRIQSLFSQGFQSQAPLTTEYRLLDPTGKPHWLYLDATPRFSLDNRFIGYFITNIEITPRKEAETQLKLAHESVEASNMVLDIVTTVQSQFIADCDLWDLFDEMLQRILALTGAEFGYVGEVVYDQYFQPTLLFRSMAHKCWQSLNAEALQRVRETSEPFTNLETLFGTGLKDGGRTVLLNCAQSNDCQADFPSWHPPISSFMALPLYAQGKLVGQLALTNRPEGFSETLEKLLTPILITCGRLIDAYHNDEMRVLTEQHLSVVLQQQEALISNIPDIAWLKDSESRFIAVNAEFANAADLSRDAIVGKTDLDLWPKELAEKYRTDDLRVLEQGERLQVEEMFQQADGTLKWVETIKTPIRDPQGQIIGTVGIARDITDRKHLEKRLRLANEDLEARVENRTMELLALNHALNQEVIQRQRTLDALKESEERFRSMAESAPVMIWMSDEQGEIIYLNSKWQEFSGNSLQEDVSSGWQKLLHPDHMTFFKQVLHQAVSDQSFFEVECRALRHDRSERWLACTGSPRYSSDGSFSGFIGTCIDVTEQKQAEETLIKSHEVLEATVTDRTKELKQTNQRLQQELKARKELEKQLVQAQKLESIGQLASGVAHEINNPISFTKSNLGVLSGYVRSIKQLLALQTHYQKRLAEGADDFELKPLLAEMETLSIQEDFSFIFQDLDQLIQESLDSTDRVIEIVRSLKSFSKMDEEAFEETNINQCIETALRVVWNELKYKCQIKKDFAPLPKVPCFPRQLEQVFMNLLVNASQAIREQGEILLQTELTDSHVVVRIQDTGEGIPADKLDQIFNPFYTTKPVGQGTGIGLSISYDLVQRHKGILQVQSEVGVGSTFEIIIPLTQELTENEWIYPLH